MTAAPASGLIDVVGVIWRPTGGCTADGQPLMRAQDTFVASEAAPVPLDVVVDLHGPLLPVPGPAIMPLHHSPARKEAA